jgi:hypothetical protein
METTEENIKAEGEHGRDTRKHGNQEERGQQRMIEKEMTQCTRRTRDSSRTKDGNGRKSDVVWSEDGDMEIGNDIEGENAYSPKRKKNCTWSGRGENPWNVQGAGQELYCRRRYKRQKSEKCIRGTEMGGAEELTNIDVVNKGGNGCTHIKTY